MTDIWKDRYTVRDFHTDIIPGIDKINPICDMIKYIPSQLGNVDHIWCLLTPNDSSLKEWLVDNIYNTSDNGKPEYFTALMTAPYVFVSFALDQGNTLRPNGHLRNNGFHAGCIVSKSLQQGLNVAQIACDDGYNYNQEIIEEYRTRIWNRFESELSKIWSMVEGTKVYIDKSMIQRPAMAVGVGYGKPLTKESWTDYKDGRTFTGQKQKKWFDNLVK